MEEINKIDAPKWHYNHHKLRWVLILVLIVVGVWAIGSLGRNGFEMRQTDGYQAVFLSNGQVYFGKLSSAGHSYKLTDIYYLQVTQALQQASGDANKTPTSTGGANATQPNIQLVKLGTELHGPTDNMYLERSSVLFWENMKSDSKVVEAISKYTSGQK